MTHTADNLASELKESLEEMGILDERDPHLKASGSEWASAISSCYGLDGLDTSELEAALQSLYVAWVTSDSYGPQMTLAAELMDDLIKGSLSIDV